MWKMGPGGLAVDLLVAGAAWIMVLQKFRKPLDELLNQLIYLILLQVGSHEFIIIRVNLWILHPQIPPSKHNKPTQV